MHRSAGTHTHTHTLMVPSYPAVSTTRLAAASAATGALCNWPYCTAPGCCKLLLPPLPPSHSDSTAAAAPGDVLPETVAAASAAADPEDSRRAARDLLGLGVRERLLVGRPIRRGRLGPAVAECEGCRLICCPVLALPPPLPPPAAAGALGSSNPSAPAAVVATQDTWVAVLGAPPLAVPCCAWSARVWGAAAVGRALLPAPSRGPGQALLLVPGNAAVALRRCSPDHELLLPLLACWKGLATGCC